MCDSYHGVLRKGKTFSKLLLRCTDGFCIRKDAICDGITNCDDYSDESIETCGEDHVYN